MPQHRRVRCRRQSGTRVRHGAGDSDHRPTARVLASRCVRSHRAGRPDVIRRDQDLRGPGGRDPADGRPFGQRPGRMPTGTRPGPRTPGDQECLPPLPDKMPPKAEPGKPIYERKPPRGASDDGEARDGRRAQAASRRASVRVSGEPRRGALDCAAPEPRRAARQLR